MAKGTPGFFDVGRLTSGGIVGQRRRLGAVKALVDFELFRAALETAVPRAERSKVAGLLLIMCSCSRS